MALDYSTLTLQRQNHPAWRLLCSDHAPLVASFLQQAFVEKNARVIPATELAEALEDALYDLRAQYGAQLFPKTGMEYLNEWASGDKGWLRKFYASGTDIACFDLTPATEKALAWLGSLQNRAFVGTESRLLTLFDLLKQMQEGSETDPRLRLAELKKQRDQIDREIARNLRGELDLLDDTGLKERFLQFTALARELLTDFREVENNFRQLDRRVREKIALWNGPKGELLAEIIGERDAIADSDQGKSFRAFWDFLMSPARQEALSTMLEHVLQLPPIIALQPDARTISIHYDWLEAADHTQHTVATLSQQLRRFLDDKAWLENRRIMEILRSIESQALKLRSTPPTGNLMQIDLPEAEIELPMERRFFKPQQKAILDSAELEAGESSLDTSVLYTQVVIDRARLAQQIRQALQTRSQISLRELCELYPLQHGLAELVTYLQMASAQFHALIEEDDTELIHWQNGSGADAPQRQARMPKVIFIRK